MTFSGISIAGLVSPVSYLSYTGTFFKKMWRRDLSLKTPVLKCKNGTQKSLGFYLHLSDSGGGMDKSDNSILLKIVGGEKGEKVLSKEKNKFFIEYNKDGAGKMYLKPKGSSGTTSFVGLECTESIISSLANETETGDIWINEDSIYGMFTEQSKGNCKRGIGRIECDIELKENSNLKWNTNEKPKVIYTAF
ncbi:hypothetical protein WEN_01550 [Mycoplasma wenyonii str. Massachusetts]|uniref:Uncharacterized protein n=1 Tax=Mycoplasma wenyonii (strain Massachusetts) TaxID=1197325 RepID=I6ZIS9_MYCWM|nr:hypothetical protein WEN_01550 [Mycoplasma wenyonii str. Massachusetts]